MKPRLHYVKHGGLIHYGRYLYFGTRVTLLCGPTSLVDAQDVKRGIL